MAINVGVFFGGRSVEHEVAVISAVQAMNYIDKERYNIIPVYITKTGEMYHSPLMIDINKFKDIPSLIALSKQVTLVKTGDKFMIVEQKNGLFKKPLCEIDIAFPIVHGTNCEDGSIVGWFELLGIPYVGCDVCSAAVGMDKAVFKSLMMQSGIPVLPGRVFYAKEWIGGKDAILSDIEDKFGYPVIVKPANLGSSVGISKAHDRDELIESITNALDFAGKILIEPAVCSLREFNCSVVGDVDGCETSVIEEPVLDGEILDYKQKYESGAKSKNAEGQGMASVKRRIPAEIDDNLKAQIEQNSKDAFTALGACGVVRIDYLYDCDSGKAYVNEINTIPGSLSFYLWEAAGVPFAELLDRMISLAFKRERERQALTFSYETNLLAGAAAGLSTGKK